MQEQRQALGMGRRVMAKPGRWELTRVHREHKDKFFKEKKKEIKGMWRGR